VGILDAVNGGRAPLQPGGPRCGVCKWLNTLTPELRAGAEQLMGEPVDVWSHAELNRIFQDDGLNADAGTLGRHRNNQCFARRRAQHGDS